MNFSRDKRMDEKRVPWWLWPNLLSLDAPLVALAWAWMFSRAWGVVSLPWELWATLGVSVWLIYAVDRIVDCRKENSADYLETRHRFHQRFQKLFLILVALGGLWCLHSILYSLSQIVLLYGAFVLFFAAMYFVISIRTLANGQPAIGKNLIAGLTFAYGASAGVHAYSPVLSFGDMVFSSEVLLFAAFCVLNMTAIDFSKLTGEDEEDASAVLNLVTLIIAGIAMFIFMSTLKRESIFFNEDFYHEQAFFKPFAVAILFGSALFFLLNNSRKKFGADAYRVLVDVAVLAPVIVFWTITYLDNDPRT